MRDTYSLYEAKAKLSAIIRRVREGRHVLVTVHGEPVAEIRPVARAAALAGARARFAGVAASDRLGAELRSAFVREGVEPEPALLGGLSWVVPDRPLRAAIAREPTAGD